jgi:hypothetical protein
MVFPSVAVTVAVVTELTVVVATVKLALVDPADTVTLLGTVALELSLLKLTTVPPEGAAELSVTVPVELLPPVTLLGFKPTEERVRHDPGFRVKLVDTVAPPDCPYTAATWLVLMQLVPIEKLTLVWPAGTVTVIGSCSALTAVVSLLLGETNTSFPPDGAAEAMVTVPVVLFPEVTVLGCTLIEVTAMPVVTVTVPCAVLFPSVAVVVTTVLLRTNKFFAVAVNVAVVAPAGTVTVLGTLRAEGLSSDKPTTEPPEGAAALRVTVPVVVPPFGMLEGLNVTEETAPPPHVPPPGLGVSL